MNFLSDVLITCSNLNVKVILPIVKLFINGNDIDNFGSPMSNKFLGRNSDKSFSTDAKVRKLFSSVPFTYESNWALLCSRALFSLLSISIAYNYNQGRNYSRQIKMRLCLSNLVNVFIWRLSRASDLANVFTWRVSRVKPSQRFYLTRFARQT